MFGIGRPPTLNKVFFWNFFGIIDRYKSNSRIYSCVGNILKIIKENGINNWEDYNKMNSFEKNLIRVILDSETNTEYEFREVKFRIRLLISDKSELIEYLSELERHEYYEKCNRILKKIKKL